jgi:hypothetical protein
MDMPSLPTDYDLSMIAAHAAVVLHPGECITKTDWFKLRRFGMARMLWSSF